LYSFVDISQNNHNTGLEHWENAQAVRARIIESEHIRPMNCVKIYGANTGAYGTHRDAQERFWRNIFGGMASSRFHRPTSGLGLGEIAQAHLRAMRALMREMDIFTCAPHTDLLTNRSRNEAYCTANPGVEYAVFFPDGGDVLLNVNAAGNRTLTVRWLHIRSGQWTGNSEALQHDENDRVRLVTPAEEGYWVALVR
jgi:hypothetical protein